MCWVLKFHVYFWVTWSQIPHLNLKSNREKKSCVRDHMIRNSRRRIIPFCWKCITNLFEQLLKTSVLCIREMSRRYHLEVLSGPLHPLIVLVELYSGEKEMKMISIMFWRIFAIILWFEIITWISIVTTRTRISYRARITLFCGIKRNSNEDFLNIVRKTASKKTSNVQIKIIEMTFYSLEILQKQFDFFGLFTIFQFNSYSPLAQCGLRTLLVQFDRGNLSKMNVFRLFKRSWERFLSN